MNEKLNILIGKIKDNKVQEKFSKINEAIELTKKHNYISEIQYIRSRDKLMSEIIDALT